MKPKPKFLMMAAGIVLLSACGNKGPLVLPPKPTPTPLSVGHAAGSLPLLNEASQSPISVEEDSDE